MDYKVMSDKEFEEHLEKRSVEELVPGVTRSKLGNIVDDLYWRDKNIGWGLNTSEISTALAEMHGLKGSGRGKNRAYWITPEALKEAYIMAGGNGTISSDLDIAMLRLCGEYHFNWRPVTCSMKFDQEAIKDEFMKKMVQQIEPYGAALLVVMHNEMMAMLNCPAPEVTKA